MANLENGTYYQLGARTYWLLLFEWSGGAIILLLIALSLFLVKVFVSLPFITVDFLELFTTLTLGLAVVAELFAIFVVWLQYGVSGIMLDAVSLRIVRGILSKHEIALPYRRIQSVEIQQTPFQRIMKVGHVVISTTTDLDQSEKEKEGSSEEIIPVMDYDLAQSLATALTSQAEVERMKIER